MNRPLLPLIALLVGCDLFASEDEDVSSSTTETDPAVEDDEDDTDVPCTPVASFPDADQDGYGDPFGGIMDCDVPFGHVENSDDCDDADPDQRPGAIWHRDADGDGFGDLEASLEGCSQPLGHVIDSTDCDDTDGTRFPGGVWYVDTDLDGHGQAGATVDACG
ncbi:MAG: hypothetical protein AAFV53_18470, partial [Myxococcota bacterium]